MNIRKAHGFALIDLVFVCGMIGLLSSIAVPKTVAYMICIGMLQGCFAANAQVLEA